MGQIRTYQTDYLRQGTEQINYKRFDYNGVYQETINENILLNCPSDLVPLNRSLQKIYEKPLKEARFVTPLNASYSINTNAQFLDGTSGWSVGTPPVGKVNEIVDDTSTVLITKPKALSGNKYLQTNNVPGNTTVMLVNDHQTTTVKVNTELKMAFNYYIDTLNDDEKYAFSYRFFVQETYNATVANSATKVYNFTTGEWSSDYQNYYGTTETNTVNSWGTLSVTVSPYEPTATSVTSVYFGVQIFYPFRNVSNNTTDFKYCYIDNVVFSEEVKLSNSITSIRKQYSYAGTFTGKYESTDNLFSNEAKRGDYYIGKFDGGYRRARDTASKTMEQIITQEILNDSRDFMTKYEGVFRNKSDDNIGLHRKIWVDFGVDTLQEPVSCYIDAMKFDVKAAEHDIRMHVPNQDDDVGSTYQVVLK